ncbi:hypothetical protein BpHYR1_023063 [Brachionus plicatilis]|uniref:Uncharacterized protein n=1 Tax=Brachionus plicatilis TaxID=10195 RepID=A0A3M7QBI2_BRAPC|nr:hypothetical protein BpHYR1_023063 [Brachionus plicatilis]
MSFPDIRFKILLTWFLISLKKNKPKYLKIRIVVKIGDLFVLFGHGHPICTILWRSHTKFRSLDSRNSATRQLRLFSSPILARNT